MSTTKAKNMAKLWILTGLGVLYYMVPFTVDGELTMCIAFLKDLVLNNFNSVIIAAIVLTMVAIAIITVLCAMHVLKPQKGFLQEFFKTSYYTLCIRIVAAIISVAVYFELGPEALLSVDTGGLIINDLMPTLVCLFFFALLLIPLLLEFGGVEILGRILQPVFYPLFKVRGSASVLAIISWLGTGSSGMILTDKAFSEQKITQKEATVITLCLATISFPTMFVYATGIAGLNSNYFPFMICAVLICLGISTAILSRIPTISNKNNEVNHSEAEQQISWKEEIERAATIAGNGPGPVEILKKCCDTVLYLIIEVFPSVIVIATLVLMLATYTPTFQVMSMPLVPLLTLLGLPEAQAAAPAFIIGFADIILPYLTASTIDSQLTIFVICVVAINQIFGCSEQVMILLKSKFDIKVWDLVLNFILKTIICVPIAYFLGVLFGI
ncbi:hypothetical protein RFF05_12590 [Bengtsoniella intestinalis]|uniref:YjiH family protein n=1 Tax=Bengtsoniella intestinalis TaxID=3073143 RepID=UPI00391F1B01